MSDKEGTETNDVNQSKREPTQLLVRVFSDVLVDFLYFDICHYRTEQNSGKYQNMEKPLKHQRRLGLRSYVVMLTHIFVGHRQTVQTQTQIRVSTVRLQTVLLKLKKR